MKKVATSQCKCILDFLEMVSAFSSPSRESSVKTLKQSLQFNSARYMLSVNVRIPTGHNQSL